MKKSRNAPEFTHFGSVPFIRKEHRQILSELQQKITDVFKQKGLHSSLRPNNPNLFHLTLSMLTMPHQSSRLKAKQVFQQNSKYFSQLMENTRLTADKIKYFTFKKNFNWNKTSDTTVSVIYLDLKKDDQYEKLVRLTDAYVRVLLKQEILVNEQLKDMHIHYDHNNNLFKNKDPHITLFRCDNLPENASFLECFSKVEGLFQGKMLECDYIDVSTRFQYDKTNFYTPLYRIYLRKQLEQEDNKNKE